MTDKYESQNTDSNDRLATVFDQAVPRSRPAQQSQEKAFAALHTQWQGSLQARKRHSIYRTLGLAASVVLAVGVVWMYMGQQNAAPAKIVASVARMTGDYATIRTKLAEQSLAGRNGVSSDAVVKTGPATRLALTWGTGGSLRLNENTRIKVLSDTSIRLMAGTIYYDSMAGVSLHRNDPAFVVVTASGNVSHIGTQFMVRADNDGAIVSVREGRVRFDGSGVDVYIEPGQQINVNQRAMSSVEIGTDSDVWYWVEDIAPYFQADGQTAEKLLDWIARETGRQLIYHRKSRQIAHETVIHGITDVVPANALEVLGVATDLQIDIVEGKIEIQERTTH